MPVKKPALTDNDQTIMSVRKRRRQIAHLNAPKARSAYALYVSAAYAGMRAQCQDRQSTIAAIAESWRNLPEDQKKVYQQQAAQEVETRREAIQRSLDEVPEANGMDADRMEETVGSFVLLALDHRLGMGSGTYTKTYTCRHKRTHVAAIAKRFHEEQYYKKELGIYTEMQEFDLQGLFFNHLYEHSDSQRILVLDQACLLTVKAYTVLHGGLSGQKLAPVVVQGAHALDFLHASIGYYHGDVKTSCLLYNPETAIVKLINFHLALRASADPVKVQSDVYTGCNRPPELWKGLVSSQPALYPSSETWPYALMVYEAATGTPLFLSYDNIKEYCDKGFLKSSARNPATAAFKRLNQMFQSFLVQLLIVDPMKRLTLSKVVHDQDICILKDSAKFESLQ